ncbi:MAG TPA: hypothetical protein VET65_08905 [Candidatus Limnocylindrales bacterium]|nr:hypothetical protein [Candidatus Limnocylindrales bacterium]
MDLVGAGCITLAVVALALGLLRPVRPGAAKAWARRQLDRAGHDLAAARLDASPRAYAGITLAGPLVGAALGWLVSPVCTPFGFAIGLLAPRLYVRSLVQAQTTRSEAQAPHLLHTLTTQLSGGATYLEALRQARQQTTDPWIRDDLDAVLSRFLLNVPLDVSLADIRGRVRSRNLGLILDTMAMCCANHLPASTARLLLSEIAGTVQFNVYLQQEVRARAAGQRLQVWLLALLVPGIYLYFRLIDPELLSVVDHTDLGRYVLLPAAAVLEGLGLYLSVRVTRLQQ